MWPTPGVSRLKVYFNENVARLPFPRSRRDATLTEETVRRCDYRFTGKPSRSGNILFCRRDNRILTLKSRSSPVLRLGRCRVWLIVEQYDGVRKSHPNFLVVLQHLSSHHELSKVVRCIWMSKRRFRLSRPV